MKWPSTEGIPNVIVKHGHSIGTYIAKPQNKHIEFNKYKFHTKFK